MADQKKRVSELPSSIDIDGLVVLGTNAQNESVKVPLKQVLQATEPAALDAVRQTANNAVTAAAAAQTTATRAEGKADNAAAAAQNTADAVAPLSAEIGNMLFTTTEAQGALTTFTGSSTDRVDNKGIINDGTEASVKHKCATPFLEIYPLSQVEFQGYSATDTYGIAFYDANQVFIAGSWEQVTGRVQAITAPEGARYVRATLVSGTTASYIRYYPIITTTSEVIPQLEDRIEALENSVTINVVDNLNSTSATDALSANQGKIIGGCIYVERVQSTQTTIGETDATHRNYGIGSDGTPSNTGDLAYSKYTDFIKLAGGSAYKYFANAPAIGGLAFYADANEASFISFVASPAGGGAKSGYAPTNAKYFRVTFTSGSSSDYFKYYGIQNMAVNQAVDEAMGATQPFIGKRISILGDSITWLSMSSNPDRGWVTYFRELLKFAEIRNYARSGATWSHTASTEYDITEDTSSISDNNVIYNQLNRLINDVENNGVAAPDFIFILAGTNDAWYPTQRPDAIADTPASVMSDESVWLNVKSIGSLTSIPKAMRYVAEMIWNKFPNCQVVVTTPLQSTAFTTERRNAVAECVIGSAKHLSWAVIEQDKVCGISRIRETQGYSMTYDGTHTSEAGAKMVGGVLASELKTILKLTLC